MLPVAATCSWLLEPQRFFLTHGLFQSLTHGATGHRQWWCRLADVADAGEARGWPGGRGSWSRASTECYSFLARHQPEPEKEMFGSGENYANYLSGSCLQKYPDVGLQIRKLSWGNLCSLFDSGSSFCKHWRPGFHCQASVRLSLAVPLSQRAVLLWDVGC